MKNLIINTKREFWEHRSLVLGLPGVLAGLMIIAAIATSVAINKLSIDFLIDRDEMGTHQSELLETPMVEEGLNLADEELGEVRNSLRVSSNVAAKYPFPFIAMFISVGWLAGFYYLLSSLYADRKDKSILFWKSLPVSETEHYISKLLFGVIGCAAIAIAMGWVTSIVLSLFSIGNMHNSAGSFFSVAQFNSLVIYPIFATILGLIWGAPLFALAMWASSAAKKSPLLLLFVSQIAVSVLEMIFFDRSYIAAFFMDHMPFEVLSTIESKESIGGAYSYYFGNQLHKTLLGIAAAVAVAIATLWYRENKFEL